MSRHDLPHGQGRAFAVASYIGRVMPPMSAAESGEGEGVEAQQPGRVHERQQHADHRRHHHLDHARGGPGDASWPRRCGRARPASAGRRRPHRRRTRRSSGRGTRPRARAGRSGARRSASGTVATSSALRTSAVTITFLRFQRSVSAPENSPKSRYGAASPPRPAPSGSPTRGPVDDDRQRDQRDDAARDREQARGEVPQELLVAEDTERSHAARLCVARADAPGSRRQDRVGGAVDVALGGGGVGDRDADQALARARSWRRASRYRRAGPRRRSRRWSASRRRSRPAPG